MTTIAKAQNEVDRVAKCMLGKGLIKPTCKFTVESNTSIGMYATYAPIDRDRYSPPNYEWFKGASLAELASEADKWLSSLPTVEERKHLDFTKLVAAALEFGKANGFEDVLVNPLAEAMKRLSENAIEDHSVAA